MAINRFLRKSCNSQPGTFLDTTETLMSQDGFTMAMRGDFNEITKSEEKLGGAIRREWQIREFRDALDFCGF